MKSRGMGFAVFGAYTFPETAMAQSADHFLQEALSGTDLPDEVAFEHPDDPVSPQDEAALLAFLQDFEADHAAGEDLKPGLPG
jgi:hypothetical protein